jgi:D-alanyl-D-alanine carboxypeptidase/D-alanyl-D-alanine-endopeptidase (penicillin-binding protein 4)
MYFRACLTGTVTTLLCSLALAQALPATLLSALGRASLPPDAISVLLVEANGKSAPRLSHRPNVPVNPASVMKLVTTYAALDLLGPAYTWRTPVYIEGAVRDGTLYGNLYIKGQGDPSLVTERLWLLLRRVQGLGINKIAGDIVLDRSAFETIEADPASFDGEPLRPYNVTPDALLINFKSLVMTFVPEPGGNSARVQFEPALAGVQMQAQVPLANLECGDYRATLKADFSDPGQIRFAGVYPTSCQEKVWSVAYAEPGSFSARAIAGVWSQMGGQLGGSVREGQLPQAKGSAKLSALEPAFEVSSPTLMEVIRDINKYSNNVMAQQLFLSLSLPAPDSNGRPGSVTAPAASNRAAREILNRWWRERIGASDAPSIDNGSGLSRNQRISAQALARMLQAAYRSALMPELMSSLPISGVDGTLKKHSALAPGSAHLKTGSLRDSAALAGYVQAASGRYFVLVAVVNHANAGAARPAFDALIDWAVKDH